MKLKLALNFSLILIIILLNNCASEYGIYKIRDSRTKEFMGNKNYYSFKFYTPTLFDKIDLSLGYGWLKGPSISIDQLETNITLFDLYATMTYFPLGINPRDDIFNFIKPYIGVGSGYFQLDVAKQSLGKKIGGYWTPQGTWNIYTITTKHKNFAEGFWPYIVFGSCFMWDLVDIKGDLGLITEYQINFGKSDNGFDFNGNLLTFGIRYSPYW